MAFISKTNRAGMTKSLLCAHSSISAKRGGVERWARRATRRCALRRERAAIGRRSGHSQSTARMARGLSSRAARLILIIGGYSDGPRGAMKADIAARQASIMKKCAPWFWRDEQSKHDEQIQ
ncbi:hypothetical protein [Burkholderia pseudomallei]|uniref:hypothetical protein n=2 Tax=Burkholderia pseudomallei TaxID=28450 RepID=UPI001CB889E8|nr:hypothetical protein [Burkholderia pseudomallei]MCW0021875.1 hypothetical protein [Burkholderia pseudomallei]MCW0030366.1 hypothetical protein [Burkholderia pseudomallei]MCW0051561.1 hypothetical protein [Burkholderia pseudomallei]MCW0114277.1 hypothetical protein [Burkholderia pseudomallei]MCW0126900.1 hypothetical protein [Burkholderia pseudomallei]